MQDIPRNELLDKLATGWRVRIKKESGDAGNLNDIYELQGIDLICFIKKDWEGEPPEPVRMYERCAIIFAFEKLRDGAAFIRRAAWSRIEKPITIKPPYVNISGCDILATDWEVWG